MNDLISRQAAIDAMCELMRHWFGCDSKDEIREIKRELGKLPSVQPEQRWTPCSKRLPEEEYVLISKKPKKYFDGGRCVTIAIRMEDPRSRKVNWRDIGFGVIPDDNVLAWMPSPEPYQGGETDEGN